MQIAPFGVELWLNEYENRAEFNLAETSISALSVRELLELTRQDDAAVAEILDTRLTYGEIPGSLRLRRAITKLYRSVATEQITLTHGTIGANHLVHLVLTEAGDHVISFTPSYDQHAAIAASIGAEVTELPLLAERGYLPDIEQLRESVREKTKLICLTNPNNPTGSLLVEEELQQIVEIARTADAYILCDEVYRGVEADLRQPVVSIADLYEKGISTGGLSKAFSLPGLRIGWVVVPSGLMGRFGDQRDYSIISVGVLDDLLAAIALENSEILLQRSRAILARNRAIVEDWLRGEKRASWVAPRAGSAALLKIGAPVDEREFALGLLQTQGVLLVPGSAFSAPGHYRIGYTCSEEVLAEGLRRISIYLDQLGA